jgi:hypothetical protein
MRLNIKVAGKYARNCSPHGGLEAEKERQERARDDILQNSDLLPPTRPHHQQFPPPPKIVPSDGNQNFNTCGGHFIFIP